VTSEEKRSFGSLDLRNRKIIFKEHYVLEPCFMNVTSIETSVNIHYGDTSECSLKMLFCLHIWLPSIRQIHHVYRLLNQKCGEQVLQNLQHSSSVALQPGVGLGLIYNTPPSLLIPCYVSPFVYSHLSQVRGHVIQPSPFLAAAGSERSMCQMSSPCFQSFVYVGYSLRSDAYCKVS
jgi:hypothetical protein